MKLCFVTCFFWILKKGYLKKRQTKRKGFACILCQNCFFFLSNCCQPTMRKEHKERLHQRDWVLCFFRLFLFHNNFSAKNKEHKTFVGFLWIFGKVSKLELERGEPRLIFVEPDFCFKNFQNLNLNEVSRGWFLMDSTFVWVEVQKVCKINVENQVGSAQRDPPTCTIIV